ncbi:MAG: DUF3387 domain-containing protein [Verrucomicrobia bacterium]|nr:MAG: DUF3387 domain-containing protein [Verrucomicrobiota bacterium]
MHLRHLRGTPHQAPRRPGRLRRGQRRRPRRAERSDWTLRESACAQIKVMVKRILNKPGYPPDLQEEAVQTVLAQAEWV